jgi:hypothetical protein
MPPVSLVVCVYKERDLLERLLQHAAGCYDDLVVVHDGAEDKADEAERAGKPAAINFSDLKADAPLPAGYREPESSPRAGSIHELVKRYGGRYYEGPRAFQQEPHWPFAWWQARHDWILRLDADEFPSDELREWIQKFRQSPEPASEISGYTCIWPLWGGKKAVTHNWPAGRNFLFHRQRVRFFGMAEAVPIPDDKLLEVASILHHEPHRKSYGLRNILCRRQAYLWRRVISESLMGNPTDLPCWRWTEREWLPSWKQIRNRPLRTGFFRLLWFPLVQGKSMLRGGEWPRPSACLNPGLHHFALGVRICIERRRKQK